MKISKFLRDLLSVLSSNVFAVFMGLLSGVIISRVLGPEGRGQYAILATIPAIVLSFGALGMRRSSLFHIASKKHEQHKVLSAIIVIWAITSILGIIATYATFLIKHLDFPAIILIGITSIIPFQLGISYMGGIFLGKENFKKSNILKWSRPLLFVLLLSIFLLAFKYGLIGAVISFALSTFIVFLIGVFFLVKDSPFKFKFDKIYLKNLLGLGVQFALSIFLIQLNLKIDILILEDLLEESQIAEIGFYSLAVNVAEQLWQLPLAIGVVIMSKTVQKGSKEEMDRKIGPVLRMSVLAGILGSIVLILIIPYIIPWIYTKAFLPSVPLVSLILPGIIFFMIFRILNSRLDGIGKPLLAVSITLPALILNVILNYIFIPEMGAKGAAIASNISYALAAIVKVITYCKVTNTKILSLILFKKTDFLWLTDILAKRNWRRND